MEVGVFAVAVQLLLKNLIIQQCPGVMENAFLRSILAFLIYSIPIKNKGCCG
jgi:hypothetical protein